MFSRSFLCFSVFLILCHPSLAAEKLIGKSCSGDRNAADWDSIAQCNGSTYVKAPLMLGVATNYTCNAATPANAGLLQWTGTSFMICNGTAWQNISASSSGSYYGLQDINPATWWQLQKSGTITYNGAETLPITVSGDSSAKISVNGGDWITSGTISKGQTLQVEMDSAAANSTTRTATITTGSQVMTWKVVTGSATKVRLKNYVCYNSYTTTDYCVVGTDCTKSHCDYESLHGTTTCGYITTFAGSSNIQMYGTLYNWNPGETTSCGTYTGTTYSPPTQDNNPVDFLAVQ